MSDDQDKALRDMLAYGTGVMMDGKHVPLDQYLLDDQILLFGEGNLPPEKLAALERMESATRADERAKVIEECAKVADRYAKGQPMLRVINADDIARSIRSLGSK